MNPGEDALDRDLEVPISALEHYSYCPRQCALIHVEQTYEENLFTVRGNIAHERVDQGPVSSSAGVRVYRSMPLWSERLGLTGKADTVEVHPSGPVPVEYKVGRRHGVHAEIQLCAQALCLEEMFAAEVPQGAVYYHATRRRQAVRFDPVLRARTLQAVEAVRVLLRTQSLPMAPNDNRCPNCSLVNACLPSVVGMQARVRGFQGSLFTPRHDDDSELGWLDD